LSLLADISISRLVTVLELPPPEWPRKRHSLASWGVSQVHEQC
jgi:hypothetical protein